MPGLNSEAPAKRGIKRKRTSGEKNERPGPSRSKPKVPLAENLSKKLHHGLREVRKAAKKAKTFELRKLVKRLKDLRKKDAASEGIEDLEKQLEVMKDIDHECIGTTALKTKIQKDHLLSHHPDVQTAIAATLSVNLLKPSAQGSPAAKVESRILSSKTLAVDVLAVVDALKEVIQPKKREAVVDDGEEDEEEQEEEVEVRPKKSKKAAVSAPATQDGDDGEGNGEDTETDNEEEAGWESGSVQENAEDSGGWESGSVDDSHPEVTATEDETSALEAEDDDDGDEEESDAPARPAKKLPKVEHKKDAKGAAASDAKGKTKATGAKTVGVTSTFLPSLAVGFTRGDSDVSDWSDDEPDVAEPRKNRRGQRARRAIWEKKYGKNANHVKEAAEGPRQNISRGRDDKHGKGSRVRLGAPSAGPRSQFKAPSADGGWPKKASSAAENASRGRAPEKDKVEKPLHPSWEAKRRLKEKLNPSILPAQGKKIVF